MIPGVDFFNGLDRVVKRPLRIYVGGDILGFYAQEIYILREIDLTVSGLGLCVQNTYPQALEALEMCFPGERGMMLELAKGELIEKFGKDPKAALCTFNSQIAHAPRNIHSHVVAPPQLMSFKKAIQAVIKRGGPTVTEENATKYVNGLWGRPGVLPLRIHHLKDVGELSLFFRDEFPLALVEVSVIPLEAYATHNKPVVPYALELGEFVLQVQREGILQGDYKGESVYISHELHQGSRIAQAYVKYGGGSIVVAEPAQPPEPNLQQPPGPDITDGLI